jgi:2-keto-4-pentenoate hydratase
MKLRHRRPPEPRFLRAGRWLFDAHESRRPFAPLPPELAPAGMDEAYGIQSQFVAMRAERLGAVGGYKIALTTPSMRAMVGLQDSIAGDVFESTIHRGTTRVRAADYLHLLIEFEIAFEMAEDLPAIDAPYTRERVARSVAAAMPAIELADDRNADYTGLRHHALTLAADNAWNEGAVLGERVAEWRAIDLAGLQGEAFINGEKVGEGHGRDVMGHPLDALAWIANNLASRGLGLWRNDVVITGSLVTSKFPKPGDHVRWSAGALGSAELYVD